MELKLFRPAVFIVTYTLTDKGVEYLLLKRRLHWNGWEFPKGGMKRGEEMERAVLRELYEETGQRAILIQNHETKGKYEYKTFLPDRRPFSGQTYNLFSAQVEKGNIRFSKIEHSEYKWFSFEEAIKKLSWPNQRRCITIVNDSLKEKKV
jgi:8-oxo-dGTP pyrophosphatase MutT (NUDIX family)